MRKLCAACGSVVSITCDHCAAPMMAANYVGNTWFHGAAMVCLNGMTPVVYSQASIDAMEKTHTLCKGCTQLDGGQLESMIEAHRQADPTVPTIDELRDILVREARAFIHETETRSGLRTQRQLQTQEPARKRGPKGVPKEPTPPPPDNTKKDGGQP
jgi:hypothetical protein